MRLPTSLIAAIAPLLLLGTLSLSVLAEPEHGVREAAADQFDAPALAARDVPAVDAAAAVKKDVTDAAAAATATATPVVADDDGDDDGDGDGDDDDDDDDDDGGVVASNSRVMRGEGSWENGHGMEKRHWRCWWWKWHGRWVKKCGWRGGHWKNKRGYHGHGGGYHHHHHGHYGHGHGHYHHGHDHGYHHGHGHGHHYHDHHHY